MGHYLPSTPAGRLSHWLGRASAYATQAPYVSEERPPDTARRGRRGEAHNDWLQSSNALVAWCTIWDLDVSTTVGRSECYSRGMSLVGEGVKVRQRAETARPGDPDLGSALEHFRTVERSLSYFTSLRSTPIVHMIRHVKGPGWGSLATLDMFLREDATEEPTTLSSIDGLLRQTDDLIAQVHTTNDLGQEAREELLDRLLSVKSALERFAVGGPEELSEAIDSTMGLMMRLYLRGVDVSRHPVTRATLSLVAAAAVVLGMGADYAQVAGSPIGRMLGLP